MISLQPREALLKYAKVGDEDPQWTGGVCPFRFFSQTRGNLMGIGCLFVVVDVVMVIIELRLKLSQLGESTNQSRCSQRWGKRKKKRRGDSSVGNVSL
jgi:hypothetical protein